MKLKKIVLVIGLVAVFALMASVSLVLAGAGPEPPPDAIIQDGELWGAVVVYCNTTPPPAGFTEAGDSVVIRVKRVVNCNVETQTLVEPYWTYGCSTDPNAPLGWSLPLGTHFFDIIGTPFISKVKNFKQDGDAYSFDAQFKFYVPAGP